MRVNLALLTTEELERLLGAEAALALLPDLEGQRLRGRTLPGPLARGLALPGQGGERPARRELGAAARELRAMPRGFVPPYGAGAYWGADLSLAWDTDGAYAFSLLRSGAELGVLSVSAAVPPSPTPSEAVITVHLPGLSPAELIAAHRVRLARHGKAQPLGSAEAAAVAWNALADANRHSWERRGLLLEEADA